MYIVEMTGEELKKIRLRRVSRQKGRNVWVDEF